jgi:hypothetical protein
MNDEGTSEQRQEKRRDPTVGARSRSLKGGLDPAELGRRSGQARRERRRAAARDAELDKLTVRARLATGLAEELTTETLRQVLHNLATLARGDGHVAVNAARLLMELARKATDEDGQPDELLPDQAYEDMTKEQQAVARARADALARKLQLGELEGIDLEAQANRS